MNPWPVFANAFLVGVQVLLYALYPSPLILALLVFSGLMFVITLACWLVTR